MKDYSDLTILSLGLDQHQTMDTILTGVAEFIDDITLQVHLKVDFCNIYFLFSNKFNNMDSVLKLKSMNFFPENKSII